MKNFLFLFISLMFFSFGSNAQTWKVDPNHSSIMFNAKHSGISFVNGRFMDFEGTVEGGTPEEFTNATVSFSAKVESVSTGAEGRDNHLKRDDFFDMENHPTISFVSKSFTKTSENMYEVVGDLTMKGNTKEIRINAHHIGSTQGRNGANKVGFQLTGNIDRNEFEVSGAARSVAPMIEIICNVEMIEQKEE